MGVIAVCLVVLQSELLTFAASRLYPEKYGADVEAPNGGAGFVYLYHLTGT